MKRLNKGGDENSTSALNLIIGQAMPENSTDTSPAAKPSQKKSKNKAKMSQIKGSLFGKKKESKTESKTKEVWQLEEPSPRKPTLNIEIPEKEKKSIFKIRGTNGIKASNVPRKPTFVEEVPEKEKKWSRLLDF